MGGWGWGHGEGESKEKGGDEKMCRGMRGAGGLGVCLGVDSMETNRPQWAPHREQAVFPRKEQPGMLNTEKHTDKYTLPQIHTHTWVTLFPDEVNQPLIISWPQPLVVCVATCAVHTLCLFGHTHTTYNFHSWMLIRGCSMYTHSWSSKEIHSDSPLTVTESPHREWLAHEEDPLP